MSRLRILSLGLFMAGCMDSPEEPVPPDPEGPNVRLPEGPLPSAEVVRPPPATCPRLVLGVLPCSEVGPLECLVIAPGPGEPGLTCIPGYEDDPSVPCFCVVAQGTDSWCIRDEGP